MIQKPNLEFNPFLICERHFDGGDESPKGNIEVLGASENIVHQTRASLPTPYEDRLGDVLEHLFGEGVTELPELIDHLNNMEVLSPDGNKWTETIFRSVMGRLGE